MTDQSEVRKDEDVTKCDMCGKVLTDDTAKEHGIGSYCQHLREQGWTPESLSQHRKELSADEVPVAEDGRPYVKVAIFKKLLPKHGIPVQRVVDAMGKDRAIAEAAHPKFKPVYVGRARYVHPDCADQWGLDFLRKMGGRSSNSGKGDAETKAIEDALLNG